MDKQTIKQLILRQQELIPGISLIKRAFPFEKGACQVLVGIRRAGKSFLLYQYIQQLLDAGHSIEKVLFLNFEDERIAYIKQEHLHLILDAYREMFSYKPLMLGR